MAQSGILNPQLEQGALKVPKLIETPRDAFQGIRDFIPTGEKVAHISRLIDAGFRRIDFGSFVSPKKVPQMQDSEAVLEAIPDLPGLTLIAIVANERGLQRALATGRVSAVGFPFSVSNTFQLRNTNKSVEETWPVVENLAKQCDAAGMNFIVYVSMAFGNPYGDRWDYPQVIDFAARLKQAGVRILSLADTTSEAAPGQVGDLVRRCRSDFPDIELGIHLHSSPDQWQAKLAAALDCGVQRVDSAVAGMGGCPFARSRLVGNIPSEGVVDLLKSRGWSTGIDRDALQLCVESARRIMELYGKTRC